MSAKRPADGTLQFDTSLREQWSEFIAETGPTVPLPRMSTEHLEGWRDNLVDRVELVMIEPGTLVKLIDEVLEARKR